MGQSTDGILAYGVDLGEFDPDEFDGYAETEECDACRATNWGVRCGECFDDFEGYVSARLKGAGIQGISVVRHCSESRPMYILCTQSWRAWRGYPVKVSPHQSDVFPGDIQKIRDALKVLGLEPQKPAWLLASDWG
jgi:hypothetical protein